MVSYSLKDLNALAKNNNFNRDTLEKVLRLVELLKMFNENEEFKGMYVLKGGTAINLCIFDFPRLSVDIDMNFNLDCNKDKMIEIRNKHRKLIKAYVELGGYVVSDKSRYSFALDSYLLKYTNAIGSPDNIKLELNYSNRIQIINPIQLDISSSIVKSVSVLVLDKIELYGSKIAALVGRTTARDIYDVYEMIINKVIKKSDLSMLKKCAIFYLMTSNDEQTIEKLLEDYYTNMLNTTFYNIRRNLIPILHIGTQIDLENMKEVVNGFINSLFVLNKEEMSFVNSFIDSKYHPERLFEKSISSRIKNHPMALWKTRNK